MASDSAIGSDQNGATYIEDIFSVNGLVAVVTGGGTGIGLMIACALEKAGADRVYILGRREDVLENAIRRNSKHGRIKALRCDITSKDELSATADTIKEEVGRIDLLVNNAGVMSELNEKISGDLTISEIQEALWAEDPAKWAKQFEVNVTGTFFTTVAFLGLLEDANKYWLNLHPEWKPPQPKRTAQVVSTVGIAALHRSLPRFIGYCASKAGVLHMMKILSTLLAPKDIRFNMLCPGMFPTEMTSGKGNLDNNGRNTLGSYPKGDIPQERAGTEEDIAGAIVYLAGRGGWYVNGSVLVFDGGRLSIAPAVF